MLNLTDQEAPHPKFSSENDFFLYLKKNYYCVLNAKDTLAPVPLWSLASGGSG